jgi:hypothetical protein
MCKIDDMTTPDTAAVELAFAAVARTQAELYDLESTLEERAAGLIQQLRLLGMELHRADERVDPALIHRLYWETPSVAAQAIYEAFGLRSPSEVYKIAGPYEFGLPCKDCKTVITYKVKNRTELAKLRSNHRCEGCAAREAERVRQEQARRVAEWERDRQEHDEAVEQAMVAYILAHPELPDEPEGTPLYVEISGNMRRGGVTVLLSDLNALRDDLRDRLRPKS